MEVTVVVACLLKSDARERGLRVGVGDNTLLPRSARMLMAEETRARISGGWCRTSGITGGILGGSEGMSDSTK